jgi:hypothetical protein
MFRFLCIVSLIASVGVGIATIMDINNLPVLISCIFSAIVNGCIAAFQTDTINSIAMLNRVITTTQQRCNKLEEEVKELKRNK